MTEFTKRFERVCGMSASPLRDDDLVTVCDRCLQASCWQGIFMCEESRDAGTREMTVRELAIMRLEHPDHWRTR